MQMNRVLWSGWASMNRRRGLLIRKKAYLELTAEESRELEELQRLASLRSRLMAPLPIKELERYLQELQGGPCQPKPNAPSE